MSKADRSSELKAAIAEREYWKRWVPSGYQLHGWTHASSVSIRNPQGRIVQIDGDVKRYIQDLMRSLVEIS